MSASTDIDTQIIITIWRSGVPQSEFSVIFDSTKNPSSIHERKTTWGV